MVFPVRPSDQEAKRRMAVNGYSTVKESEAADIDNKDDDNLFFSTPGVLFITNLSRKGKQSVLPNFTQNLMLTRCSNWTSILLTAKITTGKGHGVFRRILPPSEGRAN